MLNGLDPIIIFNFKKVLPSFGELIKTIPLATKNPSTIDLPLIPIYLSEALTGVSVDTEEKNMDADTTILATADGTTPIVTQRPITSTLKINLIANQNSIAVALFTALSDLIFPKLTAKEYSITYLHRSVTIFQGLLHTFSIQQDGNATLYRIAFELVIPPPEKKALIPEVPKITGAVPL